MEGLEGFALIRCSFHAVAIPEQLVLSSARMLAYLDTSFANRNGVKVVGYRLLSDLVRRISLPATLPRPTSVAISQVECSADLDFSA